MKRCLRKLDYRKEIKIWRNRKGQRKDDVSHTHIKMRAEVLSLFVEATALL